MSEMEKPLRWMGSSKRDLKEFPEDVQDSMGHALDAAQWGLKALCAKPYKVDGKGGAGVMEIVEDYDTDTYRAVYTIKFKDIVYVLHCFQKKSKHGSETPKPDKDLIKARLKAAEADYLRWKGGRMMADIKIAVAEVIRVSEEVEIEVEESSGNVFEDLGLPNADERLAKSRAALLIQVAIKERGLSQRQAAVVLGLDQANVSRLMCGKLSGFTLERLFRFLKALDMDVEVTVRKKPERADHGTLMVYSMV